MRKTNHKLTIFASLFCLTLVIFTSYLLFSMYQQNKTLAANTTVYSAANHSIKKSEFHYKSYSTSLSLAAVGDILIHGIVYNDAMTGNGYDFKPHIAGVKGLLKNADLTIANQETITGGTDIGLSTYPQFNSPYEVTDALFDAGVDIVSIANNHTLDRGEQAVLNATAYYDKIGMEYVGGYRDDKDKQRIRVLTKNRVKVAFLSYTYGTNGIPVPTGKEYLVNLIDIAAMNKDIASAKKAADVVAVSMHWGNEYQLLPNDEQKRLANMLANEGVDIIIGHHPHVLQPMEWITRENGEKTFVAYSLGNFLSGQIRDYKDIGGVLQIEIKKEFKDNKSVVILQNPEFTPTYVTSTNFKKFRVIPLESATTFGSRYSSSIFNEINEHMQQWLN